MTSFCCSIFLIENPIFALVYLLSGMTLHVGEEEVRYFSAFVLFFFLDAAGNWPGLSFIVYVLFWHRRSDGSLYHR